MNQLADSPKLSQEEFECKIFIELKVIE